ncbi:MAG TPA: hypothetical protein VJY41_04920 [Prolixibacteraceae bacterium]|nr:hypothetical protein [Prolixibacteraceae bacterium]
MKNKLTSCIILMLMAFSTFANEKPDGKFDFEKFKAEKIAYITNALSLTPKEAEVFWPVYNEFEGKKWELLQERRNIDNSLKDGVKEMSDEEYTKLSRKIAQSFIDDGKLIDEYNEKYLKILPPKKVVLLYAAELNFRNHLLRKYRGDDKPNK